MRMRKVCISLAVLALASIALGQDTAGRFRLSFSETDVAQVLKAVSMRTGVNIVYSGQTKIPITLNVSAESAEDALRSIVSAAGLSYRQTGGVYVVASSATMKQALEPYFHRARFTPKSATPPEIVKLFSDSLPHGIVREMPDHVVLHAVLEDIRQAGTLFDAEEQRAAQRVHPVTRLVPLRHLSHTNAQQMISAVHPELRVSAIGDESGVGRALSMTGPAEIIARAEELLERMDMPVAQRALSYHVYALRFTSAPAVKEFMKDAIPSVEVIAAPEAYAPSRPRFNPISGARIGETGSSGGGAAGAQGAGGGAGAGMSRGGQGQNESNQRPYRDGDYATTVVLRGPEQDVQAAILLLEQLDVRPRQVMVEVRVVETSPDFAERMGFRWSWTRLGFYEAAPGTSVQTSDSGGIGGDFTSFLTRPAGFGQISRVPFSFQTFLDAQIQNKEARLLANPSLSVLDNSDGSFFIGDTIRARIAQAGALGGQTVEVMEFPVGIIMLVRPRVNGDGMITLRVNPVISTVTALDQNNIPQTSTREADTTLIVRDGETIVIGGLIRDEYARIVQSVPFLSQLPVIGELFKNRSTTRRRTDVIVTITPRLMDGDSFAAPPETGNGKDGKEK
jgi:type II secretory pathway component GspD/PulD (secretin)